MSDESQSDGGFDPHQAASRDEMLCLLEDAARMCHKKVKSGRVTDVKKERVRQGWVDSLANACGKYRLMKKDQDLERFEQRLDRIEDADNRITISGRS